MATALLGIRYWFENFDDALVIPELREIECSSTE
jgi:hypothetical protein